jgi:hypothetical protein
MAVPWLLYLTGGKHVLQPLLASNLNSSTHDGSSEFLCLSHNILGRKMLLPDQVLLHVVQASKVYVLQCVQCVFVKATKCHFFKKKKCTMGKERETKLLFHIKKIWTRQTIVGKQR